MEQYERLGKIGEGASAVVYLARDLRTGESVAVKRLRPNCVGDGDIDEEAFRREVRCLESACRGHPSLVQLRFAHRDPTTAFLVLEHVGPTLSAVMRDRDHRAGRPFAETEARHVMRRLLDGVRALHEKGFIHRDIKPDNVLVDADTNAVKICDFGLSRATSSSTDAATYTAGVATLWYRAPELILGSREYDGGVDAWSLGCVMAELLAGGKPLFPGRSEVDQLDRVFDTVGGMQDMVAWPGFARLPRSGSPVCRKSRPPAPGRLRERFPALSDAGFEVLSGLLTCRSDRRLTAAEALRCAWFDEHDGVEAVTAAVVAEADEQSRSSVVTCSGAWNSTGVSSSSVAAEAILA